MRAKVWTQNGQYAEDQKCTAVMWNRGYCLYVNDPAYWCKPITDHGASCLGSMNHDVTNGGCADTAAAITGSAPNWGGKLLNNSIACIGSHANTGIFMDGPNQDMVTSASVSSAVNAKVGVQFPPSYNFVYLHGCYAAGSSQLASAFKATTFFGWTGPTWATTEWVNWSHLFWDALGDQCTVLQAQVWAHSQQSGITTDVILGSTGYRVHFVTPSLI